MDRTITWKNYGGVKVFAKRFHDDDAQLDSCADVIVLVHGLGEHSGRYRDWADRFRNQGTAVYALDLHGHGLTTGRRGHTESFASMLEDIKHLLIRARNDYPKANLHLYGHSMGGALVMAFAHLRESAMNNLQVASVVTTGTAIRPGFEPPKWKIKLATILDRFVPGLALGNELNPDWLSTDSSVVAAYKSDPLVHDRISVRWYNEWLRAIEATKAHASQLTIPALMLHGESDNATSCEAAKNFAAMIGAEFKSWPGARHELHNEPCKEDVFTYIMTWIRSQQGSTSDRSQDQAAS